MKKYEILNIFIELIIINKKMNEEVLKEYFGDNYLIICGSIILFLLVIIYKVIFSKKRSKSRKNLLICGPNNSGKTSFFYNVSINYSKAHF